MRPGNNGSNQGDFNQSGRPPTPPVGQGAGYSQSQSRGGMSRGGRGHPSNGMMRGGYTNDMRGRGRRGR